MKTLTAEQLGARFAIKGHLSFRQDASGLVLAEISNAQASAALCLQGAHLMHWQPKTQSVPVVWLSRDARLAAGKSIRGGAPVCWPWFGPHESEAGFPAHGYARTVPWAVIESGVEPCGATRLTLRLQESDKSRGQWPHASTLELTLIVGDALRLELSTENTGDADFVIGEALHTYLRVGDIAAIQLTGLDACDYWDKAAGMTRARQHGALKFAGETDRVYINTVAECVLDDAQLKRRIRVAKSGSASTVVWTPWTDKAAKMGDLGQPDGWREMLCVESANALDNQVTIAAGTRHTLIVECRAEPL